VRAIVLLVLLANAPAWAQSKRYPPAPVDKDEEAAKKSKLWESASMPNRARYGDLVREAEEILRDKSVESANDAIAKLDEAVKLMPDEEQAYRVRGDAHMLLPDWSRCAGDFHNALAKRKRIDTANADADLKAVTELRRRLGVCLARAGKLADAERTLAEAAAGGAPTAEVWMRLGEVRIAMGKLDEAIAALEAAREFDTEPRRDPSGVLVRWLLAGAFDRARRPSEATAAGIEASAKDAELGQLKSAALPLLGVGETEYLLAFAHSVRDPARLEHSLLYYRRFLKVAPDSPWRRRAEEHIRELRTVELPENVNKLTGNAERDKPAARTAVRKLMPQMRACVAKQPGLLMQIVVVKAGPRTPGRTHIPPEGVTILPGQNLDNTSKIDVDTVTRCLEAIGDKVKATMPALKDKDTFYRAEFFVVAQ
jgi:tetratricopeptide (TPR) repeat protein